MACLFIFQCDALIPNFIIFAKVLIDFKLKTDETLITKSSNFCFNSINITAQVPADLVTFTEEILNGKLHFLCSVSKPN